jgi:hypothetical protein
VFLLHGSFFANESYVPMLALAEESATQAAMRECFNIKKFVMYHHANVGLTMLFAYILLTQWLSNVCRHSIGYCLHRVGEATPSMTIANWAFN